MAGPMIEVSAVKDEKTRLRLHVLPALGKLPIANLRPHHVRDLVTRLRAANSPSPPTCCSRRPTR